MLNLHLFPADTVVTVFFCLADLFGKSALSQLKLAWWVGTSKKGGLTVCTVPSWAKGLRPGEVHSSVPGWPANSDHKPWGYPGLGHQNLSFGKVCFLGGGGGKSYSNINRRYFNARQTLPLHSPHWGCSLEWYAVWLSSAPSCVCPPLPMEPLL